MPTQIVPGAFAAGLCDCCQPSCGACCYTCCCASCAFGDLAALVTKDEHCCGGSWGGACAGHYFLGGCLSAVIVWFTCVYVPVLSWVLSCPMRSGIRRKYGIHGGDCGDCLLTWCCDPCTTSQEIKEVNLRNTCPQTNVIINQPGMVAQPPMQTQPQPMQPQQPMPMHPPQQASGMNKQM
eukprot:TRINITY_DN7060_c0_g1_i3.p1 TRINITY_DN7060_c0_g1~~TRINITY_DN7060_c0_g1_i3.p1  ORF type:complete len:180 (+),score=6.66 TRINITY_DN7060_c0_g1_i3:101-640(+)